MTHSTRRRSPSCTPLSDGSFFSSSSSPSRSRSLDSRRSRYDRHESLNSHTKMEIDDAPSQATAASKTVVVRRLTAVVNEGHLREIFGYYGRITSVSFAATAMGTSVRLPPASAAICYETAQQAHKAASCMDGGVVDDVVIRCELLDDFLAGDRTQGASRHSNTRSSRYDRFKRRSQSRSRRRLPRPKRRR